MFTTSQLQVGPATNSVLTIRWANLDDPSDGAIVADLTNVYAQDANAISRELPAEILSELPEMLRDHPAASVAIAFEDDEPVGLATCVESLSTFAAKSILNIHDIVVTPANRNKGIGAALMREVEAEARRRGCCKVSLEVACSNPALRLYEREGFVPSGTFMTKAIE